jgi:hypothetical protein
VPAARPGLPSRDAAYPVSKALVSADAVSRQEDDVTSRPSLTQRIVMRLMAGRAAEIERESREWFIVCPNCAFERTYWDIGGVRYKARSHEQRLGMRCPSCGRRAMHSVERRPGLEAQDPEEGSRAGSRTRTTTGRAHHRRR